MQLIEAPVEEGATELRMDHKQWAILAEPGRL